MLVPKCRSPASCIFPLWQAVLCPTLTPPTPFPSSIPFSRLAVPAGRWCLTLGQMLEQHMEQLSASQPLSPTLAMFKVFWERLLGRRGSPGRKLRKKPGGPQHSFSPLAQLQPPSTALSLPHRLGWGRPHSAPRCPAYLRYIYMSVL